MEEPQACRQELKEHFVMFKSYVSISEIPFKSTGKKAHKVFEKLI